MRIIYDCLNFPLWEEVGAIIVRYRGRFPRKTLKQICRERSQRLESAIDGSWQTAEELAHKAKIPHRAAVKLLLNLVKEGKVEVKDYCWLDSRFRARSIWLYSKPEREDFLAVYNSMFGRLPSMQHENIRTHKCDDRVRGR